MEGEPGRRVCAEDAQEAVVFEAFFEIVAFGGGEVESTVAGLRVEKLTANKPLSGLLLG